MTIDFDDIRLYLPKYLSPEDEKELLDGLKDFPDSQYSKFYSNFSIEDNKVYQGDSLTNLMFVNLPKKEIGCGNGLILSNSCDLDVTNERRSFKNITYAPIIDLEKYISLIKLNYKDGELENFITNLKQQRVSNIFYMPEKEGILKESIVFLDRINSCDTHSIDRSKLNKKRIMSLHQFAHYLLLFKLSIHFSRIQEHISRIS